MKKWIENYKKSPAFFWGWLILLLVLGLLGFWAPLLSGIVKEKHIDFDDLVSKGEISTFSIIILIEAFITGITLPRSKRMNMLLISLNLILIIGCCAFYFFLVAGIKTHTLIVLIMTTSILSFLLTIFLYRFKNIDLDESAEAFIQKRNSEVVQDSQATTQNQNPLP